MVNRSPLAKDWQIAPKIPPEIEESLQEFHPILRQLLYNRGLLTSESAYTYLQASQPPNTDPFSMLGMPEAVDRLIYAIYHDEPIVVYGDYDTDGVTATALLVQVLTDLGAQVYGYIPNRFDEGYGLNIEALDSLRSEGFKVVLTVDCGIRSLIEAEHARQIGMDLIISDHHTPRQDLPLARAIINPKQPDDPYPEKNLAGVGLAFKMATALIHKLKETHNVTLATYDFSDLTDLVAVGTVADLVPLTGENRHLVRAGLEAIRRSHRQGLNSLIQTAGLHPERINTTAIGYILSPRLNAAGRLESALDALRLLTSQDIYECGRLAQQLEVQNRMRQLMTREVQARAEQIALAERPDGLLLFAAHPEFNPGVVGLAASKLVELYYRPAIVCHQGIQFTRGSCRSIPEFHITKALDRCAHLLIHHGGHAAAAGFTVSNENLPQLMEQLYAIASEQLSSADLRPTLRADMEVSLSELRPELLELLKWLEPTGMGNPAAVFLSRDVFVKRVYPVGKESAHLRMVLTDGWVTYDGIAFHQGHRLLAEDLLDRSIDILFTFEINEYNGRSNLQLNIKDFKPAGILEQ